VSPQKQATSFVTIWTAMASSGNSLSASGAAAKKSWRFRNALPVLPPRRACCFHYF
jgi:hypothetical protein